MGLTELYRPSLALLTDLYQLTMAYGYWKAGVAERDSVFHLHFRRHPFGGGYAIAAGLELAIDYLAGLHFDPSDQAYLATLTGAIVVALGPHATGIMSNNDALAARIVQAGEATVFMHFQHGGVEGGDQAVGVVILASQVGKVGFLAERRHDHFVQV